MPIIRFNVKKKSSCLSKAALAHGKTYSRLSATLPLTECSSQHAASCRRHYKTKRAFDWTFTVAAVSWFWDRFRMVYFSSCIRSRPLPARSTWLTDEFYADIQPNFPRRPIIEFWKWFIVYNANSLRVKFVIVKQGIAYSGWVAPQAGNKQKYWQGDWPQFPKSAHYLLDFSLLPFIKVIRERRYRSLTTES